MSEAAAQRPSALAAQRIEVSKRCVQALNERDFDAYLECLTPDFVLCTAAEAPGGSFEVTRAHLIRFFLEFLPQWDGVRYEFVDGPQAIGDERVIARDRWIGTPRGSGREQAMDFYSVATYRGLRACRVDIFIARDAAYEFARTGKRVNDRPVPNGRPA